MNVYSKSEDLKKLGPFMHSTPDSVEDARRRLKRRSHIEINANFSTVTCSSVIEINMILIKAPATAIDCPLVPIERHNVATHKME